ncbi:MAG: alpha-amylase family protein [Candidatus Ratteibacteria bacterium]
MLQLLSVLSLLSIYVLPLSAYDEKDLYKRFHRTISYPTGGFTQLPNVVHNDAEEGFRYYSNNGVTDVGTIVVRGTWLLETESARFKNTKWTNNVRGALEDYFVQAEKNNINVIFKFISGMMVIQLRAYDEQTRGITYKLDKQSRLIDEQGNIVHDIHELRKCLGRCVRFVNGQPELTYYCVNQPIVLKKFKKLYKEMIDRYDHPRLKILELDEPWFDGGYCDICVKKFREYLKGRYRPEELQKMGIADVEKVEPPEPSKRETEKFLWAEHREFIGDSFADFIRQLSEHAHGLKKAFWPALMSFEKENPAYSSYAKVGPHVDILTCHPYQEGIPEEAFLMALIRNTTGGIGGVISSATYCMDPTNYKRELYMGMVHGKNFMCTLGNVSEIAREKEDPKYEEVQNKIFKKITKCEKYLIETETLPVAAILYSEREINIFQNGKSYFNNLTGLYRILSQIHIQAEPVILETLTIGKLARYKVLIINNTRAFSVSEIETIKKWVKSGGVLVVMGDAFSADRWGRNLTALNADNPGYYRADDLTGISYQGWKNVSGTIIISPDSTIETEKERKLGADLQSLNIRVSTGQEIATWKEGGSAIVVNNYGRGRCVYISANNLGETDYGWGSVRNGSLYRVFKSDILNLFRDIITSTVPLPFTVENCPLEVEVTLNTQGEKRYILHLLDYRPKEMVKNCRLFITLPKEKKAVAVFYPDDNLKSEYQVTEKGILITIRDFQVHEMLVVEYE